jgi:ATP-dependent DNA ligase
LRLDGRDVSALSTIERRTLLEEIIVDELRERFVTFVRVVTGAAGARLESLLLKRMVA